MQEMNDIDAFIQNIRKERYLSNVYITPSQLRDLIYAGKIKLYEDSNSYFLIERKLEYNQFFFIVAKIEALKRIRELAKYTNVPNVISIVYNPAREKDYKKEFADARIPFYKEYRRYSTVNPSKFPFKPEGIKFAEKCNVMEILGLLYSSFDVYTDDLVTEEELRKFISNKQVMIKISQDILQGVLIFENMGATSYLRCLCVNVSYRRENIGKNLMKSYWNIQDKKIKRFTLWVFSENENAKRLYQSLGYREDGLINDSYVL